MKYQQRLIVVLTSVLLLCILLISLRFILISESSKDELLRQRIASHFMEGRHMSTGHMTEPESHMTEPESHVTEPESHVTEPESHVTEQRSHMTEPERHVTEPESHMTEPESHVTERTRSTPPTDLSRPWRIWSNWVEPDVLYPEGTFYSNDMNLIFEAIATYPITLFDVGYRGTQLKASMYLHGNQRTVFKPMR